MKALGTKCVILLPLFTVTQNRIGLVDLFEPLLSLFVPLVPVRMVFEGKLSISLLDLLPRGFSVHT